MSQTNDGGPAFPVASLPGMSLRDYFAGQALAEMVANHDCGEECEVWIAIWAYQLADAMLAERQKERA